MVALPLQKDIYPQKTTTGMMPKFTVSLLLSLAFYSFSFGQKSYDPFAEMEVVMVSSGEMHPSSRYTWNEAQFNVVVNEKQDTIYLQTMDPTFHTAEGYHVNTLYRDLSQEDQKKLQKMAGWGYYIELKSGWQLGFCEGESCTDSRPNGSSTVKWIFKRQG